MTLSQLFWKLTKEKFHPSWGYFGRSSKNIYNLLKILSRHEFWCWCYIPDSQFIQFWQMFYLLHFWCSTLHLIKSAKHCLYNSGIKVDILDTCGAMICSFFGIVFLLFFIKIENAVYTSCQSSTLLFINGLILGIMNIQNNQSLEFEWKPMLAPLISVTDQRFSWLHNIFLNSFRDWPNSVQQRQGNFTKDADQKMFIL